MLTPKIRREGSIKEIVITVERRVIGLRTAMLRAVERRGKAQNKRRRKKKETAAVVKEGSKDDKPAKEEEA